jgi:DNA replication protein DnaC
MKTTNPIDAARIELLLSDLRLPAIKLMWAKCAEQSDQEGWPAARFLAALAEHEIADRGRRRIERHLAEARSTVATKPCTRSAQVRLILAIVAAATLTPNRSAISAARRFSGSN